MHWLNRRGGRRGPHTRTPPPAARLHLERLEPRELLDATAVNQAFVTLAYRDLLGRGVDATGLAAFTAALDGGASRGQVALALLGSAEAHALEVQALFQTLLHRPADDQGLATFTAALDRGASAEQVAALIAASPEYYEVRGGKAADGFLDALYQDLLGRGVDPAGRALFDQALAGGVDRTAIAAAVLGSPEYQADLIRTDYAYFLGRAADPSGLATYLAALQASGRDEVVVAGLLGSPEYAPLAPELAAASSATPDPATNSDPFALTPDEVSTLLQRAAAASASRDAIIAVVDRNGRPLGVRVEDGVSPVLTTNPALLTFAIDGALAEARTGAFFASNGTPLTSRTIRSLSQTTITQAEVMSNPDILDPNSPLRGPGAVAPIGIAGHFPPNVPFTPQVDLFDIEFTNRDSLQVPGPSGVLGSPGSIPLPNRFNIPDQFVPTGQGLTAPQSYGALSGLFPNGQPRGIGTLPGGIPIIKQDPATQRTGLVGGIGVFFPGQTGYASEENSAQGTTYDPTKRDRAQEAEYMAFAAVGAGGYVGALDGVAPLPEIVFPAQIAGRIDLVGITLEIVGPTGNNMGGQYVLNFGKLLGTGSRADGSNVPVDLAGDTLLAGNLAPEGWLVAPHAGTGLSADDVVRIVQQGINQAVLTRAAIRLPIESTTRMLFAVSDTDGNLLGLYRMPDATIFSIDVAVAKARNNAYYADAAKLQPIDQLAGIPAGVAFSSRTFRYLVLPRFPEGIEGAPPGPFSILNDGGTNPTNGLQVGPPLPPAAHQSVQGHDVYFVSTNFHDPFDRANQNGVLFFPGGVALYKDVAGTGQRVLVGGLGVSGDGVDQDDVVTFAAARGYEPTAVLKADQVKFGDVRLPYQKFNRNPEG